MYPLIIALFFPTVDTRCPVTMTTHGQLEIIVSEQVLKYDADSPKEGYECKLVSDLIVSRHIDIILL